jgi:hypothetical protein
MPSRVAAVAKIVVCVTTGSGSHPGTAVSSRPAVTQPQNRQQTRQLHVPTQTTLLSTPKPTAAAASGTVSATLSSLLYQSFHLSHRHQRHHQHHLTKMDAALAKIFVSNAQWVKAVNSAEPGFFEQSAQGQSPKVRAIMTYLLPPRAATVVSWEEILSFLLRCALCSWFLSCTY